MDRLDKILANTGRWSRKEVKDLVKHGRVTADGAVVCRAEEKYGAEAVIAVDGETLRHSAFTYLMLHKPAGYLSATEDRRQKTVLDLLPDYLQKRNLFPVGRLDKDTEGLLLLTDDGALCHALLAPKKHVDKVYYAEVAGVLDRADVLAFQSGMVLGDGLRCQPADLAPIGDGSAGYVTLREGKFHQIKRMLAAREKPVQYLKRLSMGSISLDETLEKGEWRLLTEEEISQLLGFRA
ncbi:MAG: 16S rRNA pseudouridine(516) synthase [Oscillospiraceae bacterium]